MKAFNLESVIGKLHGFIIAIELRCISLEPRGRGIKNKAWQYISRNVRSRKRKHCFALLLSLIIDLFALF